MLSSIYVFRYRLELTSKELLLGFESFECDILWLMLGGWGDFSALVLKEGMFTLGGDSEEEASS